MSYIIYKTTNTINGKYYIGVHNDTKSNYLGSGKALLNAIKEHGRENFVRETLQVFATEEEAYAREANIVNETFVADRNTYNVGKGGKGGPGQPKSEEHKRKIAKARAKQTIVNAGRKQAMPKEQLVNLVDKLGFRGAAEELGISWSAVRGRYYRYTS
jgi:hypothetical protein